MMGSISLTQAQSMITDSIHWAQENNQHIAVAVVDSVGELIAFSRMDETSPQTCLLAQNKAYTAARDRQKTSQLAAWAKETSKTINLLSGLFFSMECAIDCIKSVFPAFGGETISPL